MKRVQRSSALQVKMHSPEDGARKRLQEVASDGGLECPDDCVGSRAVGGLPACVGLRHGGEVGSEAPDVEAMSALKFGLVDGDPFLTRLGKGHPSKINAGLESDRKLVHVRSDTRGRGATQVFQ